MSPVLYWQLFGSALDSILLRLLVNFSVSLLFSHSSWATLWALIFPSLHSCLSSLVSLMPPSKTVRRKSMMCKAERYCFSAHFRLSLSTTGTFALTDPEKRHLACSLPSRVSGRSSYGVIIHVLYGKMMGVVQPSFKKYGTDIKCGWSKTALRKERDRSWGR